MLWLLGKLSTILDWFSLLCFYAFYHSKSPFFHHHLVNHIFYSKSKQSASTCGVSARLNTSFIRGQNSLGCWIDRQTPWLWMLKTKTLGMAKFKSCDSVSSSSSTSRGDSIAILWGAKNFRSRSRWPGGCGFSILLGTSGMGNYPQSIVYMILICHKKINHLFTV